MVLRNTVLSPEDLNPQGKMGPASQNLSNVSRKTYKCGVCVERVKERAHLVFRTFKLEVSEKLPPG